MYATYFTITNTTRGTIDTLVTFRMDGQVSLAAVPLNNTNVDSGSSQTSGNTPPAASMGVLYALTGIFTVLFLVIIATDAWKTHGNPERYRP
jgi:hypothetical protein